MKQLGLRFSSAILVRRPQLLLCREDVFPFALEVSLLPKTSSVAMSEQLLPMSKSWPSNGEAEEIKGRMGNFLFIETWLKNWIRGQRKHRRIAFQKWTQLSTSQKRVLLSWESMQLVFCIAVWKKIISLHRHLKRPYFSIV